MKQGMEESDIEGLATQVAPSHALAFVKTQAKHWQGYVQAGPLSREITHSGVPTLLCDAEGKIAGGAIASRQRTPRGQRTRACTEASCARTGRARHRPFADPRPGRSGKAEAVTPR